MISASTDDKIENMISIYIPGSGLVWIGHFVSDFSGTLSEDGVLLPGVRGLLNEFAKRVYVHVLTSDTFGET